MEKIAPTQYPIHSLIARRWSARAFDPNRPISAETLGTLFEAARWAPSNANEQPWRFIVGVNFDECHRQILSILSQGNRQFCGNAPVLLIAVAKLNFTTGDQKPNAHALHDLGMALENMFLQAVDLGLYAHFLAAFSPEKATQVFQIPEGFQPITAGALAYPGELSALPEDLREKELVHKPRKPFGEFVFTGAWGNALGVLE